MLNTTISKKNLLKVPAKEPPYYKINPPDKVVAALNDDQSFDKSGIYFTMVYMIINFRDNVIQYTRAGHNPPILVKADGRILINDAGGFPVGWDFPREDPVVEMKTEPGDRLFMFSDGITEATDKDEELFSRERMANILSETRKLPLEESLDRVIKSVRQFSGRDDFEDDVSIIGLAWK
jgi:sigma-B regulation protein RsbU (phosphoserine phosphatase)